MNEHTQKHVPVFLALVICVCATNIHAQDIDYARENAGYDFPQTHGLRIELAVADSARTATTAYRQLIDSLLSVYDSLANISEPYLAYPVFHHAAPHLSLEAASKLSLCAESAHQLYDSVMMLRLLAIQRNAMRVDSITGVVDLIPLEEQYIYRLRSPDSSAIFVQTGQPHHIGDTLTLYAVRFGRKIFPSRTDSGAWEMAEGAATQVPPDSIYEVLRETPKPHIYDTWREFAERFALLQKRSEPQLDSAIAKFRAQLRTDDANAEKHYDSLDDTVAVLTRQLWGTNILLAARQIAAGGKLDDYLKAVDMVLRLQSADSSFAQFSHESNNALVELRLTLDSIAHLQFFGSDGIKNMLLIPGGEVTLHTGERFAPTPFLFDSLAVTNEEFNAFEKATGYMAHGNWRAGFVSSSQNTDLVLGLQETDKIVFARWAGKRPAAPQEREYVAAGGYPTLAEHAARSAQSNLYGIAPIAQDGFYCVRDLSTLTTKMQESLSQSANTRTEEIRKITSGK